MGAPLTRLFYVRYLAGKAFEATLAGPPDVRLDRIDHDTPEALVEEILAHAHGYQIGTVRSEIGCFQVTDALLARTPKLLAVSTHGAGYDTVDIAACTRAGVAVMNQSGGNAESVAEHAVAMLLALAKRIPETDHALRRAPVVRRADCVGCEALGKTLGIIGIGNIGRRVAEICRTAFRMRVLACDPYLDAAEIAARGGEKTGLHDLLRRADFVSVHCPLTAETEGMLGAAEFALMPQHAVFVTTARGAIHDEAALAAALRERRLLGAGPDVWAQEPPAFDHPLLAFDNVLASAHTAGSTQ